ncbi:uncharacterized protein LOC121917481 [Sceloporus undulatus]|uniref:uncharacterized protein LOC121917481 n=1 Tax=Sceloporus undulatus TaxID=8520 RepID=UPI001C4D955B|nr:uncharacterized protein LOC121917481 [Sceloporus undulatus]
MAHRFSKEDLDEQFEQFLKESLSDDSLGNEPKKNSSVPETIGLAKKKQPLPWWISEDDSDEVPKTNKFIKQSNEKKPIGDNDEMAEDGEEKIPLSNSLSVKVVTPERFSSASCSKALARYKILEKSLKAKKNVYLNKEDIPASDNLHHTEGKHGTSGSFLKSQRLSHSLVEVDEDHVEGIQLHQPTGASVSLSKDSLETNDSVVASGPKENILGIGLDTLEEEEEKERFFADLEKGASSTIDYSRLNKELDSNDSEMLQAFLRNHSEMKQVEEENEDEPKNHEKSDAPGDYSEDFEEDSESNQDNKGDVVSELKKEKTSMLAKVVLLDSQDSALETQKASEHQDDVLTEHNLPKEVIADEMNGTGVSCGQTNSDIEALHQAYCHIEQSLGDTDEQKSHTDKIDTSENLIKEVSQNKEVCPPNTSNTDSDLPTIEELMKPIKADTSFARGCDLEPPSSLKVTHGSTDELVSHLPFKEPQNDISNLEKQNISTLNHHSEQENVSIQPEVKKDSEDTPQERAGKDKLANKVKQDTWKQNILPNSSPLHQNNKPDETHQPITWNKESLSSVLNKQLMHKNAKNTVAAHRKKSSIGPYSSVRSSGYGKSSSSLKHFSTVNEKTIKESLKKPVLKARSPLKQKETPGTKVIQTTKDPVSMKRNYCATHGESSASSIQEQVKENDPFIHNHNVASYSLPQSSERELYLLKRIQEAEEKLASAHSLIQQLKATSLEKEKEMKTKILQQDKDLFELNKETYVLQSQLNHNENLNKETKWSNIRGGNPADGEMLKEIQKEVQNQEMLLQGYQQENERLYNQVKELQLNNKKNEENMFKENQRLMIELTTLREQVDKNNLLSCGVQNAEPAVDQNLTDLILELRSAKAMETNLLEEKKCLKQDKQALEVDLLQIKKERDLARAQIASTLDEKSYEMKLMEESYKDEISRLQKRLQWYAENQELLDKDASRLRGAKEEIDKLKLEVIEESGEVRAPAVLPGPEPAPEVQLVPVPDTPAQPTMDFVHEMEGATPSSPPGELPPLFPHSEDEEHGKEVRRHEAPDLFFNSETGRYFMSVPRDVAFKEFTRLNPHPADPREGTSARSIPSVSLMEKPPSSPRRRSQSSTGPIPVQPRSQVRVPDIPLTSDTDSEDEPLPPSDVPSEDDDLSASASPQRMHHPEPSSPSDDMRSFSEHIVKMARALDIELSFPEDDAHDLVERQVHGRATSPVDQEAKKVDGLAKKAYLAAALAVKAINYNACMGAYIQTLMEQISSLILDIPDEIQRQLAEVRDEAHSIGSWLNTASRNMADCAGRAMSASTALRRHAWLRASDLNPSVKAAIDMPLDGTGLFHAETDDCLNRKFRMKAAAKKHGMSSASVSPFRKWQRPWQPRGQIHRSHPRFRKMLRLPSCRPLPGTGYIAETLHLPQKSEGQGRPDCPGSHGINDLHDAVVKTPSTPAPGLVSVGLLSDGGSPVQMVDDTEAGSRLPELVAGRAQRARGDALSSTATAGDADNRCFPRGLGRPSARPSCQGQMVRLGQSPPHQCPRDARGRKGPESFRIRRDGQGGALENGQHHRDVLHQQTRWHQVKDPPRDYPAHLGLVHTETGPPSSDPPSRGGQRLGRPPQQIALGMPRMEAPSGDGRRLVRHVGNPPDRPLRYRMEQPLAKEDSEEYIAALKASHQKELEKILCQHAVEHSTYKVAELNSKISTQEIFIKHLQQQVHEFRRDQEALVISQKREEILQKEMAKLLEELGEARERQTPEMKHFVCLERKIKQLETRYEQREQELQQVIQETRHIAEVEQIQETEKWRKLALLKNQELEKFRIELDSMLDVLRQLQKQGVIIPVSSSNMPESYWKI